MIKAAFVCSKTISGKHMWVEVVLYNLENRLKNPTGKKSKSYPYWRCHACGMIDDTKETK